MEDIRSTTIVAVKRDGYEEMLKKVKPEIDKEFIDVNKDTYFKYYKAMKK